MKKILCLVLVLTMLCMTVIACTNQTVEADKPGEDTKVTDKPVGSKQDDKKDDEQASDVKMGGTLRIYMSGDLTSMDNIRTRVSEALPAYETILYKDANGNYCPRIIESLESDVNALTYTMKLKNNPVYFHDGSVMTSEVLAWNINQYKEIGYFASSFSKIEKAEAVDEKTVVIHMAEWDMLLPNCLARMCTPVSKEYVEKNGWDSLAETECGTGPFMLKEWKHGESIEYVKFDKYYEGEPRLDSLLYLIYGSADVALMALQNGELDVVPFNRISYSYLPDLSTNENLVIYDANRGGSAYTLGFNCVNENDPLFDVNVRKAICYAIDTDVIGKALTEGFYYPGSTQWSPNEYVYCSDKVTGYPYDVAKAKELLTQAGYENGFKTSVIVQAPYQDVAVLVQAMLKEVGIDCEIQSLDRANFDKFISGWESGMLIHTVGVGNGQEYQITNSARSDVSTGYGSASFKHTDELDALCKQALTSAVEDSYAPIQRVAEIMFEEDIDMKVLFLSKGITVAGKYVKDAGICANGDNSVNTLWLAWLDK